VKRVGADIERTIEVVNGLAGAVSTVGTTSGDGLSPGETGWTIGPAPAVAARCDLDPVPVASAPASRKAFGQMATHACQT
jgi:hypothetical protein